MTFGNNIFQRANILSFQNRDQKRIFGFLKIAEILKIAKAIYEKNIFVRVNIHFFSNRRVRREQN